MYYIEILAAIICFGLFFWMFAPLVGMGRDIQQSFKQYDKETKGTFLNK